MPTTDKSAKSTSTGGSTRKTPAPRLQYGPLTRLTLSQKIILLALRDLGVPKYRDDVLLYVASEGFEKDCKEAHLPCASIRKAVAEIMELSATARKVSLRALLGVVEAKAKKSPRK